MSIAKLKIARVTLLAALVLFLASCRVSWVPSYSAAIETQILQEARNTNMLYLRMLELPEEKRLYASFAEQYIEIESGINSITLANEGRKKKEDMARLIDFVHERFVKYKNAHRQKGTLTDGEAETYDDYMKAAWKPLLLAEQGLKIAAPANP